MPRYATMLLTGLVLTTVACGPSAPAGAGASATTDEAASRHFELTYSAVVEDVPEGAGEVRIWLPYPTDDEAQEVEVTEVSAPYSTRVETEPEYGNSILYLEVDEPNGEPVPVEITARVHRTEKVRKDFDRTSGNGGEPPPEVARWLEPDALVPLDERIRGIAAEATEGAETDLEKAKAIYDYVLETMRYDKSGEGWGRGDIYWACDAKTGNCTDFHALFIGLNRAVGIPAKFAIGFPIPADRGQGEIGGYHCWAEFWIDGYGWVPVDTSEAWKDPDRRDYYFGAHDENRVEFTEGRDLVLAPRQEGDPLNFFVYPYAEVDGEPWGAVSQRFTYRDLAPEETAPAAGAGGR
ncbi:MAG: transglutaminase-like domain-containing protein [Acidobacteriota bacterium]